MVGFREAAAVSCLVFLYWELL